MNKKKIKVLLSLMIMVIMMVAMTVTAFAKEAPQPKKETVVMLKATASGTKKVKLNWTKVDGAKSYIVYGQLNNNKYKKIATVKKSKNTYTVQKIADKALTSGKVYKFKVVAKTSKGNVTSKDIKFITGNKMGKYANVKTLKVNKNNVTLEVGKSETIKATKTMYNKKKHLPKNYGAATRYISDNTAVAKVSSKGVITAVAAGSATIYVQDLGGLYKTVKVTVRGSEGPTPTPTPTQEPTKTYTVTFDMKGHGTQIDPVYVKSGEKLSKSIVGIDPDYGFDGWYKDADCNIAWDYDKDVVTKDVLLYAKWGKKVFKAVEVEDSVGKNISLMFYYDDKDYSSAKSVFVDGTDKPMYRKNECTWGWEGDKYNIKEVVIDESVKDYHGLTITAAMFFGIKNADSFSGAEYFDVSNVTDMHGMFKYFGDNSTKLTDVPNVTGWDTSNVKNISYMFEGYGASSITLTDVPDVSGWDTSNVKNISGLLKNYGCESKNLKIKLDLRGWNLENVTESPCDEPFNPMGLNENGKFCKFWKVTIPAKTKETEIDNDEKHWYVGGNTEYFVEPLEGEKFTVDSSESSP